MNPDPPVNLRQSPPEPLTGIKTGPDVEPGRGRVLVFGASGYIGTHLVARLLRVGVPVRAAGRTRAVLEARHWPGVEIVVTPRSFMRPVRSPLSIPGSFSCSRTSRTARQGQVPSGS